MKAAVVYGSINVAADTFWQGNVEPLDSLVNA